MHEQKQAMDVCKSYFKALIRSSVKPVTVWGPEETCLVQSITTVSALNTHWKTLLGAVQESVLGVLAAKTGRRQFVQRLHGPVGATDTGPAAQITQVRPRPPLSSPFLLLLLLPPPAGPPASRPRRWLR